MFLSGQSLIIKAFEPCNKLHLSFYFLIRLLSFVALLTKYDPVFHCRIKTVDTDARNQKIYLMLKVTKKLFILEALCVLNQCLGEC